MILIQRETGLSFKADILLRDEIEKYLLRFTFKMYILLLNIHNEKLKLLQSLKYQRAYIK